MVAVAALVVLYLIVATCSRGGVVAVAALVVLYLIVATCSRGGVAAVAALVVLYRLSRRVQALGWVLAALVVP